MDAEPNMSTANQGNTSNAGGQQPVFAMPPPPATGVNPFTGAPVAATEQTSLNTTEQTTYTPGI